MSTMKNHPTLNRRLVREAERIRARDLMLVVLLSTVTLLPVLAHVWQNVEWIQVGYRIEKLKSQRDRLVEMQQRLRLEKASLESLARVERVSLGQLGLSQPPDAMVVLIDRERFESVSDGDAARIASATGVPGDGAADRRADGTGLEAD